MATAINPQTGEVLYLDGDQWKPAPKAVNPQTGETRVFDGADWVAAPQAPASDEPITANTGIANFAKYARDTVSNVPKSAANMAADIAHVVVHPVDTVESIGNIGKGILQKFGVVGGDDAEKYADVVGKFFKDRYGSAEAIAKTLKDDPVGAMADVSAVITMGGSAAARAPGIAGKLGEVAATAGRAVDPLNAVAGTVKGAGKLAAEVAGVTTGAGSEAIKTAARSGAEGGTAAKAFREGMSGTESSQAVVGEAKAAVNQLRAERGVAYRDGMAKIGADTEVLDFSKVDSAISKVANVKTYKGQDLSPATADIRSKMLKTVEDWKELPPEHFHTAEGLDALKQKLGDIRDATLPNTPERIVADQVYQGVRKTIIDQAPEYANVMKGYEQASTIIREIESTLSLKPTANIDTSLRKLQSVLRNNVSTNYGRRAELVDFLTRAGAPHLMEKLSGQALSSATPRGLARVGALGEGASAITSLALGHPGAAAALAGTALASSPALVGGVAHGLGMASRLPLRGAANTSFQLGRTDRALQ